MAAGASRIRVCSPISRNLLWDKRKLNKSIIYEGFREKISISRKNS